MGRALGQRGRVAMQQAGFGKGQKGSSARLTLCLRHSILEMLALGSAQAAMTRLPGGIMNWRPSPRPKPGPKK